MNFTGGKIEVELLAFAQNAYPNIVIKTNFYLGVQTNLEVDVTCVTAQM